ncbi:MAG TPA: peptide deformylase [Gammaproteobacteria bacterium]|nr:peptide deformylase [Gammaproteobacteria bacterium]
MALLDILVYPDPRLRNKAKPVDRVDLAIQQLIDDMAQTMYAAPGIGLAATQVNIASRILIIDISDNKNKLQAFINPEIIRATGEHEYEEGCLSVPGVYARITRPSAATVRALDREGNPFEVTADGLLATCLQHEIDHLDGKVFVDYLSRLKQERIRKKMHKELRQQEPEPGRRQAI